MCKKFCSLDKWPLIVFAILWLPSCGRAEATQLVSDNTEFQVLSIEELYPQAEKAALEWQEDAYLDLVSMDVFPATETFNSLASFSFRSHAFPEVYFSYHYKENGTIEISQSEGEFPVPQQSGLEINPDTLPFDSQRAFKIMWEKFGKDIYADCSIGDWPATLTLRYSIREIEELTWSISFTCISPQNWGAIIISAETGEVLEIRK